MTVHQCRWCKCAITSISTRRREVSRRVAAAFETARVRKTLYDMTNRISIKREYWSEVTGVPHFIVDIDYEGVLMKHDDIYFDFIEIIISELSALEKARRGNVRLDGGCRFDADIVMKTNGALSFNFKTESVFPFPGKLILEGYFAIDGEFSGTVLCSLLALFNDGKEFVI